MKLVSKRVLGTSRSEIKSHEWMKRGRFLAQTKRKGMCLPCLAIVVATISLHLCTLKVIIHVSHIRKPRLREYLPQLVLLRRGQGRFKSRSVQSFPYVFLPPGPMDLSCPLMPWIILCPGDPPNIRGIGVECVTPETPTRGV